MKYGPTEATVHLMNENFYIGDSIKLKVLLCNYNCLKQVKRIEVTVKKYIEAFASGNNQFICK